MKERITTYSPSPLTPLPGERGGVLPYFRSWLVRGEGLFRNCLTFILLGATILGQAQTFPVRVTPILTPPYSPFLTDYTDPGAEKLTVQLILNDITVSEFRTKLRLTIEGVNITITTNPNYIPPPITLQGGVPQLIYGSDIADYFKLTNLVFQGLSPNEVEKNGGRLPEGIYRISIEVLDYNRNTVVSNKGSATAWMILNDPPFINLPINNVKIKPLNPQNIVFQWTPRHRGSPNAAFTTEYEVKLVEIWPAGRNPYDAINTLRPIFEVTTESTMIVYGPAETPLVLGREYALQVRAKDTGGRDVFKNNGYSEVVKFIYGDECPMPTALDADDISTARARMKWQGNGQNSGYLIKLREQKEGARWFTERTEQSYYSANNLRAGATYEYQLTGECDIYQSKESEVRTFSTLAENPNAFVCSDPNAVPPPDGSPPLPALFTNDFIHAGGFDVVVNQATGSNGRFTGEGLAIVPWFNSAKVRVTFRDISVNTSYQLTAGRIESVWDANSKFLVESEKTLAEGGGNGLESKLGTFEADTLIAIPGIILGVSVHPETGEITVDTRDGAVVIPREVGKTVAITDEAGNGYLVDKDGKVTKTTASDAQLAGARGEREYSTDPNLQIDFIKAGQTTFGLDDYQSVLSQNYQQTENGKYVSWKALASGQTDEVAATALGNGDITKATFKTALDNQVLSPSPLSPNTQVLTITGKTDGMVDELLAFYPNPGTTKGELVAGKLNLISYDIAKRNLVLVSVNEAQASGIANLQQRLNEIYGQGVVEWTSVQQQKITVNGIDETNVDDGGSGLLSNYTEDMKKILRAYTDGNTMAENTYYLFLVKNSTSKNKLGYMPRKRQAGFIFVDAHNGQDMVLTMAHELGHGAFHLKHTFSEYSLAQGVTENLMDYPAKTRLDKWQWDKIHNPEAVLGLFEDDKEGALENLAKIKLEPLDDSEFIPGLGGDEIEIKYSIEVVDDKPITHAKIEIYKNDGSLVFIKSSLEINKEGSFQWNGKKNEGKGKNQFIRFDESPFTIKLLVSNDEIFLNALEAVTKGQVDQEIDEWNDNLQMQTWVLCDGCSDIERYHKYKELKSIYERTYDVMEDSNPMEYFRENITFDDDENKYTFLNRSILVHKNFYPVLKDVEEYIKTTYGTSVYDAISEKYNGKIQTFSMRYVNSGSVSSSSISPHGLGVAIDVEPKKNPQIIYNERPLVFFLLRKVTGVNFNPGAIPPSRDLLKAAHRKFLQIFENTSINDLKSSYSDLQAYNENDNKYELGGLSEDVVKIEIDRIKDNLQEIKARLAKSDQITVIETLLQTVENQIFIVENKVQNLDRVLPATFNVLVFSFEAKSALNYLDNTYLDLVKTSLKNLNAPIKDLRNALSQTPFHYDPAKLDVFLSTNFSIDKSKADSFSNECNNFISELRQINESYANFDTFGTHLRGQVIGIGFKNVLLEDGFCDFEENFLDAILSEAIQRHNTEWGGQYDTKKDWMHFGINRYFYEDYLR